MVSETIPSLLSSKVDDEINHQKRKERRKQIRIENSTKLKIEQLKNNHGLNFLFISIHGYNKKLDKTLSTLMGITKT